MTELLCPVFDREIFENETELNNYSATLSKTYHRSLYKKYTINNINLDDFDKILSDYISQNNKKFYLYFFKLTFELKINNNITQCIETNYYSNYAMQDIKSDLLCYIEYFIWKGFEFCHINYKSIDSINDRCNMTYEYYINQPMPALELRLNMIIAKNPESINSLDRTKNHPLIRKYSHIPFNN